MESTMGSRLRELREAQGLYQRDVAQKLGIAVSTYALYENNRRRPNPTMVKKLCDFFHCDTNFLYGYSDKTLNQTDAVLDDTQTIMVFDMDALANGNVSVNQSKASFALPKDLVQYPTRFYFSVKVEDESMIGYSLKRGDYAVFCLDPAPVNGKACLVSVNGKVMIRVVELGDDGNITQLVPGNDVFKPIKPKKSDKVTVIGRLAVVLSAKE